MKYDKELIKDKDAQIDRLEALIKYMRKDIEDATAIIYACKKVVEASERENAELKARLSKAVELPAIVMIERTLVNGKFKPTQKAQAFNGRIGVVYRDETKWKGLLVDICSEKPSDYEPAKARLAELKGGEGE